MPQDNQAKVVYLNEKGYGFIKTATSPSNVFFHASACREFHFSDLKVGDIVSHGEITEGDKGLLADDIMPVHK